MYLVTGCKAVETEGVQDNAVPSSYLFSYRMHLGLDCGMIGDCGYKIELSPADTIRYWQSTGVDSLVSQLHADDSFRDSLYQLLVSGSFFDLSAEIPDPMSRRGMRTVTYEYQAKSDSTTMIKTAFLDETMSQFPAGFLRFDSSVRDLLLTPFSGIQEVRLDTTKRVIH